MARRFIMTAKRRAALRKAQLASARKRRKEVKAKRRSTARAHISRAASDKAYAKKRYKTAGGYSRAVSDNYNAGGFRKAYALAYTSPLVYGISRARGKRAAKKKRK